MAGMNESPRDHTGGTQEATTAKTKASRLTPCEHLDRAAHWLEMAERNWGHGPEYANAAKLAELHIMMADRAEFRGQCDA